MCAALVGQNPVRKHYREKGYENVNNIGLSLFNFEEYKES